MNNDIQKKEILPDSSLPRIKGKDDKGRKIKTLPPQKYDAEAQIKQFGLKPVEKFSYTDPITGETKSFTIDRRGTTEAKVGITLLDPEATRDQKDSAISMYLFEQGKQGASMLMDLWMYKGAHTKESRVFQSQMRFDFEAFLSVFQIFMQDSYDLIWKNLPLEVTEVEFEEEINGVKTKVKRDIVQTTREVTANEIATVLGEFGRYHKMTSDLLGKRMRSETEKRERARGKGIYIGMDNKPYSVHEDGDIIEVVKKDREAAETERDKDAEVARMKENDGKSYVNDKRPCAVKECKNTGYPYCFEHDA